MTEKEPRNKSSELNDCYTNGEICDKELFAEMRSNLLLVSGEHYSGIIKQAFQGIRGRTDLSQEQKIRLTRNHIQRIQGIFKNTILSAAPGVAIFPNNEQELKDVASARIRQSVWTHLKKKHRLKERFREDCQTFLNIGEIHTVVKWSTSVGEVVGYESQSDENGEDVVDENGELVADESKPIFSGGFEIERHYGFNVIRDRDAESFRDSPYLIFRKMVDTKKLKKQYKDDEEKLRFITEDSKRTYVIFDGQSGTYGKSHNQTMVREHYYRPCHEYPRGYFYICTDSGILEEGELPFGVWPVSSALCETIETSPRGRSPIKHMRPYQMEINRKASKMAEHQVTLGDDKVITTGGAKLEKGNDLPGIRHLKSSGMAPTLIEGRTGEQYLAPLEQEIEELYSVMGAADFMSDESKDQDPFVLLYRAASQKKVHKEKIERFEQYLTDLCEILMKLAQHYLPDTEVIPTIGSSEAVNLDEFRNLEDLGYQISIEPISEDIETRMGKQLVLNQAMQYGASVLGPENFIKLIKNMPFGGLKDAFKDVVLTSEKADNVILALERGKMVQPNIYDDHPYMIQRLTAVMNQLDFEQKPPQVQMMYQQLVATHEQLEAQKQAQLQAAKNEYIPTGGGLIACDFYVSDPKNPLNNKRARVPYDALSWLIRALDLQGNGLDKLEQQVNGVNQANIMNQGAQIAAQSANSQPTQPQMGATGL